MSGTIIIHFYPLEDYPPITNLINELSSTHHSHKYVYIVTTHSYIKRKEFQPKSKKTIIKRIGSINPKSNPIRRFWNYLKFYCYSLYLQLKLNTNVIVYFETISALPAICYHCLFNRKSKLIAHYHEYTSPLEYKSGMTIVNLSHIIEKRTYHRFYWISHTNKTRLNLFIKDNPGIKPQTTHILPNYPPADWAIRTSKEKIPSPIRMLYIGALSLESMFLKEICKWTHEMNGKVILDIYTNNYKGSAREYITSLGSNNIIFRGPINYYDIPTIAKNYQIGLILYKGSTLNHVYSAPNKLFEYLSCGLDVWFPTTIKGCYSYITKTTFPKVIPIDFINISNLDLEVITSRNEHTYRNTHYCCEKALYNFLRII